MNQFPGRQVVRNRNTDDYNTFYNASEDAYAQPKLTNMDPLVAREIARHLNQNNVHALGVAVAGPSRLVPERAALSNAARQQFQRGQTEQRDRLRRWFAQSLVSNREGHINLYLDRNFSAYVSYFPPMIGHDPTLGISIVEDDQDLGSKLGHRYASWAHNRGREISEHFRITNGGSLALQRAVGPLIDDKPVDFYKGRARQIAQGLVDKYLTPIRQALESELHVMNEERARRTAAAAVAAPAAAGALPNRMAGILGHSAAVARWLPAQSQAAARASHDAAEQSRRANA